MLRLGNWLCGCLALPILLLLTVPLVSSSAGASSNGPAAAGLAEPAALEVMQNRKHQLAHEFALAVGTLPTDFFYKGLTGSLGYTLHFTDSVAWEIGNFTYSYNVDTKTKQELMRIAGASGQTEPSFAEIQWLLTSRLVLKPIYGKQAWFNTKVVHIEAFLLAGPALLYRSPPAGEINFGFDVGIGFRLWLSQRTSLRVDIAELVYFIEEDARLRVRQAPHMHLGLAINFGGAE